MKAPCTSAQLELVRDRARRNGHGVLTDVAASERPAGMTLGPTWWVATCGGAICYDFRVDQEKFIRVVGRRRPAPAGEVPRRASREAMSQMAQYRTRAPKGVFLYSSHEEANQDRERWLIASMLAQQEK
jgi:hypothetical protein